MTTGKKPTKAGGTPRRVSEIKRIAPGSVGGYSVVDAAALLGTSEATVRGRVRAGELVEVTKRPLAVDATAIEQGRAEMLRTLGAVEERELGDALAATEEARRLREKVDSLEAAIRLLLAMREERRQAVMHESAEQRASDELMLRNLHLDVTDSALGSGLLRN